MTTGVMANILLRGKKLQPLKLVLQARRELDGKEVVLEGRGV
jgi:hypothetical protein